MCTSWINRVLILFLIQAPLYCYTINISVPEYSKHESIGNNSYDITVSEQGVIQNIYCKNFDGTEQSWCIDNQKNNPVVKETAVSTLIVKAFNSSYYILTNGMVYTAYQTTDNIQFRYEFMNKSDAVVEVLCSINHGDSNKNVYDTYSEKIEIHGKRFFSDNEEAIIHNLKMIMRTGLAEILLPYILCKENSFFKPELKYTSATELREGNIIYYAENLKTLEGNPWATDKMESAEIFIDVPVKSNVNLAFYNGFQHPTKKYLYDYNSRAKDILIVNVSNKKSKSICLKDIPEKQVIDITDIIMNEGEVAKIKIQIGSVYSGSKYKDLCIQSILLN